MKLKKMALAWLALAGLAAALPAQNYYAPYYGKNRIVYEDFKWKSYKTEHFELYYYAESPSVLTNLAAVCESAYKRISEELKHQLVSPVPILFYTTYTDLEQSNVFGVSEGVLGVSEPVLQRIGLHGDMPLDELQSLLNHELTHIFEFDILWGSQGGALYALSQPPLWTFEGLAELNTGQWTTWSSLILRDSVLNDRIPEFSDSGELFSRYPLPREPAYDFGHAIYEFLKDRYGPNAVQDLWQALKTSTALSKKDPLRKAFDLKAKDFSFAFKKYLRERVKPYLNRENPEDYGFALGPEFPMNPYFFSFSHALSPSGDIVATITYNARDYKMDIVLVSVKDGTVLRNITKGYTTSYQYIKYEIDPSRGKLLSWSPDGDRLAFIGRDERRYSIYIVDSFSGSTKKKVKLDLDQPDSPCFTADGKQLLFTAFREGRHDIYRLDLASGAVDNLTRDDLFEKAPAISPDGRWVAYSIRVGEQDLLFLSPLDNLQDKKQLTFGPGSAVAPQFTSDGKTLFFSGDKQGAFNIYSLNLETGLLRRYTDVRTGNFSAQPLPGSGDTVVFCSFNKGAFQLFRSTLKGLEEETVTFAPVSDQTVFRKFAPVVTVDIAPDKVQVHKGIGKMYIASRPPIEAIVSTDGSIFGGSAVSFSDLMGNHNFNVLAYQVRSFRSYALSYMNLAQRLQFAVNAFQYTLFYYPDYVYYDPTFYELATYRDAIATREITGLSADVYYPLDRYYRLQGGVAYYHLQEDFLDPSLMQQYMRGRNAGFLNGNMLLASLSLVGETTAFKGYGPVSGHTLSLTITPTLPVSSSFLSNTSAEADLRGYLNLGVDFLLAARLKGFGSWGRDPFLHYFGGNNEVRSAYYYSIIATEAWFANLELRFPVLSGLPTILGNLGPVRGVIFFDIARAKLKGYQAKFYDFLDTQGTNYTVYEAVGSIGYGFQMFFLGLPIHLEFVKKFYIPTMSEPWGLKTVGDFQTKFWIGFDF
jgi:Tol biopolymer transport system component